MFNKFHFILAIYFALAFIISIKHTYAYLKKGKMRHFRSYSVDSTYSFKTEPAKAYAVLASNCFFIGLLLILFVLTALFQFNILESSAPVNKNIFLVFVDFCVTSVIAFLFIVSVGVLYEQYLQKSKVKPISKAILTVFPWIADRDSKVLWFPYDFAMMILIFLLLVYYATRILA